MASKLPPSRSKDVAMSAAFNEKSRKEKVKLQQVLATQLQQDMQSLFQEGEFSDITLTSGVDRFEVHLPLIQTRLPDLYAACCSTSSSGGPLNGAEKHQEFDLRKTGISPEDAHKFLQLLYTSDDIKSHWDDAQSTSNKSQSIQSEKTDIIGNNHTENCQPSNSESPNDAGENLQINENTSMKSHGVQSENLNIDEENNYTGNCQSSNPESPNDVVENNHQIDENTVHKEGEGSKQENDAGTAGVEEVVTETRWRKTDPDLNTPSLCESSRLHNGHCDNEGSAVAVEGASHHATLAKESDEVEHLTNGNVLPDLALLPEASSPLGRDLLKMFASGYGHDVKIKVEDKEIPAHKFILCTRSQYFAAMLGGSWRESSSAEVNLEGVSYSAVLATLYYIYGGSVDIEEDVSLREMVYLADMYCLEGLKDVTALKLRQDYCHFFHKPCKGCLVGIAEAIMLSDGYRITEMYDACVRWVVKYLDRVWNHRSFASIPAELIRKCSEFAIGELAPNTAVNTVTLVDKLVHSLPRVKWADPIHTEARWLLDECIQYVALNFLQVIQLRNFDTLLVGLGWNKDLLDPLFTRVVHSLTIDTANLIYLAVHHLKQRESLSDWNEDALLLVDQLFDRCHSYIVTNVNHLIHAAGWQRIPEELRSKIKEDAVFVDATKRVLAPRPVLSSSQKNTTGRRPNGSSSARRTSKSAGGQRSTLVNSSTKSSAKSKP